MSAVGSGNRMTLGASWWAETGRRGSGGWPGWRRRRVSGWLGTRSWGVVDRWTGIWSCLTGFLALLAAVTTWIAGAVGIGRCGCGACHPLTSGRGAGGGWGTAGIHRLRCAGGAGRDWWGTVHIRVGWALRGAGSLRVSVEEGVGKGAEGRGFAVGQWCEGRAGGRMLKCM
jgi:hypothetical protein